MSQSIKYSCEVITGNKARQLKKDETGYYEHNLGAFNIYNSAGKYYPMLPAIKKMFEKGGSLRRRLDNGRCKGELGHPAPQPGQSLSSFIQRLMVIEDKNVACHIRNVELREAKDEQGNAIVLCVGVIKGTGPYGNSFEGSLLNPEENTALSIRSLTNDKAVNGRVEKHIHNIITWDVVNEPGIAIAGKYDTPSMEAYGEELLLPKDAFITAQKETAGRVGLESCNTEIKRVLTDLGWETVAIANPDKGWFGW